MKWNFIYGEDGRDVWVKQSECGKYLLICNYKSCKEGVERTIQLVNLDKNNTTET